MNLANHKFLLYVVHIYNIFLLYVVKVKNEKKKKIKL